MDLNQLFDRVVRELERPRILPAQVGRHLSSTYGTGREEVGAYLDNELPGLEDYEIDLILSPVFTPTLADQALFAEALGSDSVGPDDLASLIQKLVARPIVAPLQAEDGSAHSVKLREVSIERYVRRLRLEGSVPPPLLERIGRTAPAGQAGLFLAVARRAVWNPPQRREILAHCLARAEQAGGIQTGDLITLLRLAETYEPADLADLRARLPGWIESARRDATSALSPKPFFNERVEDLHGGGRDQRRGEDAKAAAGAAEKESLERLKQLLAGD